MHMRSCMRAYATVQKLLCHGTYCEPILSFARASCSLLFAASFCCSSCCNPSRDAVRSRNPTKFTLAHDAVASAVSHKHHSIIRVWCRPHPVCLRVALALGHGAHSSQKSVFAISARVFSKSKLCEALVVFVSWCVRIINDCPFSLIDVGLELGEDTKTETFLIISFLNLWWRRHEWTIANAVRDYLTKKWWM